MAAGTGQAHAGEWTRRARVVAAALATITVLGTIIWTRGWVWNFAAWFGASAAMFALTTARARRAARAGERGERRRVERSSARKPSRNDAGASHSGRGQPAGR